MIIIPPVLLTIGMVIMRTGQKSESVETKPMAVTPSLYLKPASSENYATESLMQNSTMHGMENILKQFEEYHVGVKEVQSISGLLNNSQNKVVNLGFDIREFPVDMVRKKAIIL